MTKAKTLAAKKKLAKQKLAKQLQDLPKGLAEFRATLWGFQFSSRILPRLAALPEVGDDVLLAIKSHADLKAQAEKMDYELARFRRRIHQLAESVFDTCVERYSIKQLQKATGYTDE